MGALEPDHVIRNVGLFVTILTQNVNEIRRVLGWHRRVLDLRVQVVPQLLHVDHRGLAGGTGVMSRRQQLFEAGAMQQVAAVWYVARNSGRVNVLEAHRAIRPGDVLHALQHDIRGY